MNTIFKQLFIFTYSVFTAYNHQHIPSNSGSNQNEGDPNRNIPQIQPLHMPILQPGQATPPTAQYMQYSGPSLGYSSQPQSGQLPPQISNVNIPAHSAGLTFQQPVSFQPSTLPNQYEVNLNQYAQQIQPSYMSISQPGHAIQHPIPYIQNEAGFQGPQTGYNFHYNQNGSEPRILDSSYNCTSYYHNPENANLNQVATIRQQDTTSFHYQQFPRSNQMQSVHQLSPAIENSITAHGTASSYQAHNTSPEYLQQGIRQSPVMNQNLNQYIHRPQFYNQSNSLYNNPSPHQLLQNLIQQPHFYNQSNSPEIFQQPLLGTQYINPPQSASAASQFLQYRPQPNFQSSSSTTTQITPQTNYASAFNNQSRDVEPTPTHIAPNRRFTTSPNQEFEEINRTLQELTINELQAEISQLSVYENPGEEASYQRARIANNETPSSLQLERPDEILSNIEFVQTILLNYAKCCYPIVNLIVTMEDTPLKDDRHFILIAEKMQNKIEFIENLDAKDFSIDEIKKFKFLIGFLVGYIEIKRNANNHGDVRYGMNVWMSLVSELTDKYGEINEYLNQADPDRITVNYIDRSEMYTMRDMLFRSGNVY